jgi:hypothetical protein
MYDPARFVTYQRTRDRDQLIRERAVKRPLLGGSRPKFAKKK